MTIQVLTFEASDNGIVFLYSTTTATENVDLIELIVILIF